jgi:integrase
VNGSIKRYCTCKGENGKQLGARCPQLAADSKHGQWELRDRLPSTAGTRPFRRRGMPTKTAAGNFRKSVYEILDLSQGERQSREKLGDLIFSATVRGGQLPEVAAVKRRLGVGLALDRSQTTGEWLDMWVKGKWKAKRESAASGWQSHIDCYLKPILGDVPLDRLAPEHINDMFDLIEERNVEIELAKKEGRRPNLPGDIRRRKQVIGGTTQRRIFETLRNALNAAWRARRIDTNPCHFVELPPERRQPARVWSPDQVGEFLDFTEDDRLHLLWRLVLLHGLRRGEATGLRWQDTHLEDGQLRITQTLLAVRGKTVVGLPKTQSGERPVSLDPETAAMLKKHRTQQKRERLQWGEAYEDHDLVFPHEDGTPTLPNYVTRRFRQLVDQSGLPVITLHMGRHTAATLALEAKVDIKIVSERLGHSNTSITQNLYQHVRKAVHDGAAEAVVALLPPRKKAAG